MAKTSTLEFEKDLNLSHFTFENLPEAVFWVNSKGNILYVNDAASKMSGYSKEELISMHVHDINPSEVVADFKNFWKTLREKKRFTFESKHKHKTGYLYDIEISGNYIEYEGHEITCSIVRDIRKRRMEEDMLRTVSEATSGLTGKDFFTELARHITVTLSMRYALITECANDQRTRLRTLCYVDGNLVLDNIEYDTADIPCEIIMRGEDFFMPFGVEARFPKEKGIESYVGVPIYSPSKGDIIGHIIAVDPNPVTSENNQTAILKIFAARVGAELERMKAEKELEVKNCELNKRLNEIELYHTTMKNLRDQIFWMDKGGNFIRVNDAVSRESGYTVNELMNMSVFDINPTITKKEWKYGWDATKKLGQEILETEHRNKEGRLYPVEVTNNFIEYAGTEYFCSSVRDIRKRKMEEELLRTISEQTAGITGEDYLLQLAKFVTFCLNIRYAMVSRYSNAEQTKMKMLSYVERHEVLEGFEYELSGTPCEVVMKGNEFFCANNLELSYPREKGINSWIAVPIYSPSTGKAIGNIGGFDDKPMTKEQNQVDILKIFAARAGAEIERLEAQKKLEEANEELAKRLVEIEVLKNQLQAENKYLQEEIKLNNNFEEIISKSKIFHRLLQQIEQVASTDATVLITGESGTGKELLARAVHNISNRSKRPLIKINCANLPANLIESELFGHERGAFTGAMERKIGRFELADNGTIFLDEIGELPVELQAKLLRVLQEGEFERLGNPKTMKVNVRVIAATNRNLEEAITKKEFREDLFYRLNVFPVISPPLRDRKEDIPLLVKHFVNKYEGKMGKQISNIPAKVIDALMLYDWPGNIRELENLVERALILSPGNTLEYGNWIPSSKTIISNGKTVVQKLDDVEKDHIISVLNKTNWKVSGEKGAAKILGLNPTTLEARMKKMGIQRDK
ncbi:MAG: sigma 54-interacting transcriptional regulator [Ferruginibacter sp.]